MCKACSDNTQKKNRYLSDLVLIGGDTGFVHSAKGYETYVRILAYSTAHRLRYSFKRQRIMYSSRTFEFQQHIYLLSGFFRNIETTLLLVGVSFLHSFGCSGFRSNDCALRLSIFVNYVNLLLYFCFCNVGILAEMEFLEFLVLLTSIRSGNYSISVA